LAVVLILVKAESNNLIDDLVSVILNWRVNLNNAGSVDNSVDWKSIDCRVDEWASGDSGRVDNWASDNRLNSLNWNSGSENWSSNDRVDDWGLNNSGSDNWSNNWGNDICVLDQGGGSWYIGIYFLSLDSSGVSDNFILSDMGDDWRGQEDASVS